MVRPRGKPKGIVAELLRVQAILGLCRLVGAHDRPLRFLFGARRHALGLALQPLRLALLTHTDSAAGSASGGMGREIKL